MHSWSSQPALSLLNCRNKELDEKFSDFPLSSTQVGCEGKKSVPRWTRISQIYFHFPRVCIFSLFIQRQRKYLSRCIHVGLLHASFARLFRKFARKYFLVFFVLLACWFGGVKPKNHQRNRHIDFNCFSWVKSRGRLKFHFPSRQFHAKFWLIASSQRQSPMNRYSLTTSRSSRRSSMTKTSSTRSRTSHPGQHRSCRATWQRRLTETRRQSTPSPQASAHPSATETTRRCKVSEMGKFISINHHKN